MKKNETSKTDKPVEYMYGTQKAGGFIKEAAIDTRNEIGSSTSPGCRSKMEREDADISETILSWECGGSDSEPQDWLQILLPGYVVECTTLKLGATGMLSNWGHRS